MRFIKLSSNAFRETTPLIFFFLSDEKIKRKKKEEGDIEKKEIDIKIEKRI